MLANSLFCGICSNLEIRRPFSVSKLSSNVKKIIYDENLDIRKEERKKAKENMQAVIIDIKNMAEALKIDINEIF